jgi:hypothetical protein
MPPEENKVRELEARIDNLEKALAGFQGTSKHTFKRDLQLANGRRIVAGTSKGLQIGTESTQKLGFFGATPVAQQADIGTISEVGTDQDGAARATINQIITVLDNLGFTAT